MVSAPRLSSVSGEKKTKIGIFQISSYDEDSADWGGKYVIARNKNLYNVSFLFESNTCIVYSSVHSRR
jgi:hypothetical protein